MFSVVLLGSCTVLVPAIITPIEVAIQNRKSKYKKVWQEGITHDEYMSKITNKDLVLKSYGAPNNTKTISGVEVWNFILGESQTTNSSVSVSPGLFAGANGNMRKTTSKVSKIVEFQFKEGEDIVQNWRTENVDYSVYRKKVKVANEEKSIVKVWPKLLKNTAIGFGIDLLSIFLLLV